MVAAAQTTGWGGNNQLGGVFWASGYTGTNGFGVTSKSYSGTTVKITVSAGYMYETWTIVAVY